MYEDWENDPYAKQWMQRLNPNSLSPYKSTFDKWQTFIQMTPTQQIQKRIRDLQSTNPKVRGFFEDKVREFMQMLDTQGYKQNTVRNMITSVRSFFSNHRVKLMFGRTELKITSSPKEKIIDKFVPNNEEIRAIYEIAKIRDKALLLVLYQSGFSPVDTLSLNIEHIKNLYELEDHYYIQIHREKTDSVQATCISKEAINDIQTMLKSRGSPTEGPLFISAKGKRLTQRFLNDTIKKIATKVLPAERGKKFIAKSLRDAYNCALLEANLTQEVKDLLFGHKRSGAKSSYAYNETVIRNAYEKVFKHLSINGSKQTRLAIQKVEQSVLGLSEIVAKQQKQIESQKKELEQQKDSIIYYSDQLDYILRLIDNPEEVLLHKEMKDGKLTGKTVAITAIPLTKKQLEELEEEKEE